jgi:5-methylcytosine-specific restriction endonuclease McrA
MSKKILPASKPANSKRPGIKINRQAVYDKFNGHCAYCGCMLEKGWHADHVEPCRRIIRRKYDKLQKTWTYKFIRYAHPERDHIDNIFPSCPSCNINKHGNTIEEFRNNIAGYLRSLNARMVQYKVVKRYGLVVETDTPVIFYFERFDQIDEMR